MNVKIFFLTILLAAILALALRMNSPVFVMAVLFLPVSFLASLSVGGQSFTLAKLPFLFLNGAVFFLFFFENNLTDGLLVSISAAVFFIVFSATSHFSFLHKALPNIASEEYENFALKYKTSRDIILAFLFFTAFIWYINAFAAYSFFSYPFYSALLIIFFITYLLTSLAIRVYAAPHREEKISGLPEIYTWAISLIMLEASWVIGFWPFGYLTAAFIITIIYYVVLAAVKEYFFGKKQTRQLIREFLFGLAVVSVVFYFMRWLPV